MLRAAAVDEVVLVVERLAGRAVEAGVRALVEVAALAHALHEALHEGLVLGIGRADEEVVGRLDVVGELAEALRDGVGPLLGRDARGRRRLLRPSAPCSSVPVRRNASAPRAPGVPRRHVGRDRRVGVAEMRLAVDVVDRRRDVVGLTRARHQGSVGRGRSTAASYSARRGAPVRRATSSLARRAGRPSSDELAHRLERFWCRRSALGARRGRDDQADLPALGHPARGDLACAAVHDLLVQLRQLARDRDRMLGSEARQIGQRRGEAARRLEHDARERGGERGSEEARPLARGPRHPAEEGVALGRQAGGDECGLHRARARQDDHGTAFGERTRHEQAARIGDQGHARVRHERDLARRPAPARSAARPRAARGARRRPRARVPGSHGHSAARVCGACPRRRSRRPPAARPAPAA